LEKEKNEKSSGITDKSSFDSFSVSDFSSGSLEKEKKSIKRKES